MITLGIIGIVAALTLPSLINNYREKETVAKLKKIQSVMSQAIIKAVYEHGPIETWGLPDAFILPENPTDEDIEAFDNAKDAFWAYIKPGLITVKSGKAKDNKSPSRARYSLDGTEFKSFSPLIVLADGTEIPTVTTYKNCDRSFGNGPYKNVCGEMFVDINGSKPPNATGKDVFLFYITNRGLIPMGAAENTSGFTFENSCNLNVKDRLNGYGCAAWVIYNENMDYLKCNDLSWHGKTKCK